MLYYLSMATPDYVLIEDVHYTSGGYETKTLLAGTFVRPIDKYYIPQHVKDKTEHKFFNEDLEMYCYTPHGIILIRKNKMRKT